jgi:hypothetical protein
MIRDQINDWMDDVSAEAESAIESDVFSGANGEHIARILRNIGVEEPDLVSFARRGILYFLITYQGMEAISSELLTEANRKDELANLVKHARATQKHLSTILRRTVVDAMDLADEYLSREGSDCVGEQFSVDDHGDHIKRTLAHDEIGPVEAGNWSLHSLHRRLGSLAESVEKIQSSDTTGKRRGRPTEKRKDELISDLMDFYEELTGRKATITSRTRQLHTFLQFAQSTLSLIAPDDTSLHREDAIRQRALKRIRANKSKTEK